MRYLCFEEKQATAISDARAGILRIALMSLAVSPDTAQEAWHGGRGWGVRSSDAALQASSHSPSL